MATPGTNVALSDFKLAQYLTIALKQRERALAKFAADYGPSSATVTECTKETAELKLAIAALQAKK